MKDCDSAMSRYRSTQATGKRVYVRGWKGV
jgi:hypothetical protein